jgi:hypothetical protein
MAAKQSPPIFEILFEGSDVYPEKIPVAALGSALSAVQRLAEREPAVEDDEVQEDLQEVDEDRSLRLVAVKRGSAVFRISGPAGQEVVDRLRAVGRFIANPEKEGESDYMLAPVERLSATARGLKCKIVLREPGRDGGVLARIEPETYQSISQTLLIEGETSFVGRIQRVGGATEMKCGLRVGFQNRMMFCKVASKNVARKIGERLYEDVVVHGRASWLKTSWRIFSFVVMGISQPKQGSLTGAFEELRKAGGDKWDHVADPAAYLEEVTGER